MPRGRAAPRRPGPMLRDGSRRPATSSGATVCVATGLRGRAPSAPLGMPGACRPGAGTLTRWAAATCAPGGAGAGSGDAPAASATALAAGRGRCSPLDDEVAASGVGRRGDGLRADWRTGVGGAAEAISGVLRRLARSPEARAAPAARAPVVAGPRPRSSPQRGRAGRRAPSAFLPLPTRGCSRWRRCPRAGHGRPSRRPRDGRADAVRRSPRRRLAWCRRGSKPEHRPHPAWCRGRGRRPGTGSGRAEVGEPGPPREPADEPGGRERHGSTGRPAIRAAWRTVTTPSPAMLTTPVASPVVARRSASMASSSCTNCSRASKPSTDRDDRQRRSSR